MSTLIFWSAPASGVREDNARTARNCADYQISAGDSVRFDLSAGIHTIEGVCTTPLPGNGTQMSGADDKEFVLDQCEEVNIYYDL